MKKGIEGFEITAIFLVQNLHIKNIRICESRNHENMLSIRDGFFEFYCKNSCYETLELLTKVLVTSELSNFSLYCDYHKISHDSLRLIADFLQQNNSLDALSLKGCSIDDEGITILSGALQQNTSLKRLDLSENLISQLGLKSLNHALLTNKTLSHISVIGFKEIEVVAKSMIKMLKQNAYITAIDLIDAENFNETYCKPQLSYHLEKKLFELLDRNQKISSTMNPVEKANMIYKVTKRSPEVPTLFAQCLSRSLSWLSSGGLLSKKEKVIFHPVSKTLCTTQNSNNLVPEHIEELFLQCRKSKD